MTNANNRIPLKPVRPSDSQNSYLNVRIVFFELLDTFDTATRAPLCVFSRPALQRNSRKINRISLLGTSMSSNGFALSLNDLSQGLQLFTIAQIKDTNGSRSYANIRKLKV